jgi:predicted metal-dependent peptidase
MVYSTQGLKRATGLLCLSLSIALSTHAQQKPAETISRKGFTLTFTDKTATGFDTTTKRRLIDAFFEVYPAEAKRFNKNTAKEVHFIIDPAYDGVAATTGVDVTFNPEWFKKNPEDIDVVTHEVMHIVQRYPRYKPVWLTEGIADYVRYKFGVNNPAAHWSLPEYNAKQSYTNSYRITARFLSWLEEKKDKKIVEKLDDSMRQNTYTDEIWKKLTGKTVDELWAEYAANPQI